MDEHSLGHNARMVSHAFAQRKTDRVLRQGRFFEFGAQERTRTSTELPAST